MYRSRLAEILFNKYAAEDHIAWHAESRALGRIDGLSGISTHARQYLELKGLEDRVENPRDPVALTVEEFERANLVVGLCAMEHRPLYEGKFPTLANQRIKEGKLVFWNVFDTEARLPFFLKLVSRLGGYQTQHPVSGTEHIDFAVQALVRKLAR